MNARQAPGLSRRAQVKRLVVHVGLALGLGLTLTYTCGAMPHASASPTAIEQAGHTPAQPDATRTYRIIVKMKHEPAGSFSLGATGFASLDASTARLGVQAAAPLFDLTLGDTALKRELGISRIYMLTLPSSSDPQGALATLSADPAIEYAELDYTGFGTGIPDDYRFDEQWNLHNTGQYSGTIDADIDALEAWDISRGVTSTILAIIDTGVDLDHPDLAGKIVAGYDFVYTDTIPQDDNGHGTHVAGIAAAATNNGIGVAGVCPGCLIMPLKALDSNDQGSYSWWASAIVYAVDHGAAVINLSAGGKEDSPILHDAVRYAYNANVPIVAAMMNDGDSTIYYPAAFTETIAVGSTNRRDERSSFSNYGDHIDLVAPGTSIWSTAWDDAYAAQSGTSMAVPHVAGVLGLIHSIRPGYTVEELRAILRATADDQVGPPNEDKKGWDPHFGSGRLNAARALQYVAPPPAVLTVCHEGCAYDNIQDAVDTAGEGSVIKVAAGVYTGVNDRGGLAQTVYISKSVTIRGGYTTAFADPPDPIANPATLDAQGSGRVLYVVGAISPTVEGLRITGGDAAGLGGGQGGNDAGGGILAVGADVTINTCLVFSNTAHWGGGLYLQASAATLTGNTIVTNSANDGAGLYLRESDATLAGNTVAGNAASHDGGGVYLLTSGSLFTNNVIADNRADTRGSGLYIQDSAPRLLHTTVVRNTGSSGVYVAANSTAALTNTILAGHATAVATTGNGAATLAATLWGAGEWANTTDWEGTGIVSTDERWGDPAFVDPAAGDYHIQPASAAIDAGIGAGVTTDMDGQPRPQGNGYDIGADEAPPFSSLVVAHRAAPNPVQAGAQVTLTIRVTNTGNMDLHATVTGALPAHVVPGGARVWTPTIIAGGVWEERVVVTVEVGYAGPLTSEVRVTTDEGASGADEHAFVVAENLVTVSSSQGGIIVASGGDGTAITIQVPPGAVAEPTQLAYTSVSTVTDAPSGFAFAGRAFRLEAYRNGELQSGLVFGEPATVTIHYADADVSGLNENTLELRYWDGGAWSISGITVVERDTAGRRLVARIEHLSEFATFAQEMRKVYLPLVVRQ